MMIPLAVESLSPFNDEGCSFLADLDLSSPAHLSFNSATQLLHSASSELL